MKRDRTRIEKGMRLVGGACEPTQISLLPCDRIAPGTFMTLDCPPPRYGVDLTEIGERMDALQRRIDALRAGRT